MQVRGQQHRQTQTFILTPTLPVHSSKLGASCTQTNIISCRIYVASHRVMSRGEQTAMEDGGMVNTPQCTMGRRTFCWETSGRALHVEVSLTRTPDLSIVPLL